MGGTEFRQFFILNFHDLAGQVTVLVVPEGIDREHFHIDGLTVHGIEALLNLNVGLRRTDKGGRSLAASAAPSSDVLSRK